MSQQRCECWREEIHQYNRWDFHFRRQRIRLLATDYERESASIGKRFKAIGKCASLVWALIRDLVCLSAFVKLLQEFGIRIP